MSNELKAKVTADTKQYNKAMKEVGLAAKSAAKTAKSAFVAIGTATLTMGFLALKTALTYEELGKRMQVIFGMKEGAKFFNEISRFASTSAADTEDLVRTTGILAGIMGTREEPAFYEAAVFASRQMNKTVLEGSTLLGKFFKTLETGGKVDKEVAMQLGQVFGADFIDRVNNGQVTYEQAMDKFNERAVELGKIWGKGLGAELNRLEGSWQEFIKRIGQGQNLEAVQRIVAKLSKVLMEVADSGVLEELSDGFASIADNVNADDMRMFLENGLEIMKAMVAVMGFMVKHWEAVVASVVAYKAALIAASTVKVAGALAGAAGTAGAAGLGGKAVGLLAKAGPVGAIIAGGIVAEEAIRRTVGRKFADRMVSDFDSDSVNKDPATEARLQAMREKIKNRPQKVEVMDGRGKNAYE